jgi:hypothetical protein
MLKNINRFLEMHGFSIIKIGKSCLFAFRYLKEYRKYKKFNDQNFPLSIRNAMPILSDYKESAGTLKGHYVHQDLWAATKIYQAKPKRHVDIGSRIDGFITSLISHRTVEVIDIRPLISPYENLIFIQDDATKMSRFKNAELESVSCLHAMEHFGLGRYGDPIDPDAYKIFAASLTRVIKPNGTLYISMPIGKQRVEFNAHRIFDPQTILDLFNQFELISFSAINDTGDFIEKTSPQDYRQSNFSCGLFELKKKN